MARRNPPASRWRPLDCVPELNTQGEIQGSTELNASTSRAPNSRSNAGSLPRDRPHDMAS
jgi:hypothetical protein